MKDIQVDTLQVIASTPLTRHELKEHRALGREMEDMARNHRREMKSRVHGRTHCRACDGPLPGRVEDPLPGMCRPLPGLVEDPLPGMCGPLPGLVEDPLPGM